MYQIGVIGDDDILPNTPEWQVAYDIGTEIAKAGADRIFIKDVDGLLTPERTRTLARAILEKTDGVPIEIHAHCTTGLAPLCYLEAAKIGVQTLHTAVAPLANGPSQPSIENILMNTTEKF